EAAPMLYLGEKVGNGKGPAVDIALDPLEGTGLTAKDMPNAMTVIAMAPAGTMLRAPEVAMEKLAIGPGYAPDVISLEMSPTDRVLALAQARGVRPADITCCVLDRPRHADLIAELRETGAAIRLMTGGELAGVIHCGDPALTGIDVYMGVGRAPEGVLAAAALKCMGGQIWARLICGSTVDHGIIDPDRILMRDDLVRSDVIFAATGVTDGSLVRGVRRAPHFIETETILMRSKTGSVRRMMYRNPIRQG
ncbi:MAG TPA: fructose-bisphosphatase class II family protein, partial [Paenirhodobacter sp.]